MNVIKIQFLWDGGNHKTKTECLMSPYGDTVKWLFSLAMPWVFPQKNNKNGGHMSHLLVVVPGHIFYMYTNAYKICDEGSYFIYIIFKSMIT